jgi:hypothetical protein
MFLTVFQFFVVAVAGRVFGTKVNRFQVSPIKPIL